MIKEFPLKGRGIVASKPFTKGEFVVEYIGDLIDMAEANEREKIYAKDENTGCYMYYFKYRNQQYWSVEFFNGFSSEIFVPLTNVFNFFYFSPSKFQYRCNR